MGTFSLMGLFSIIPMTILLAISFFVLFTAQKITSKGLQGFGWVIAVLLWVCAIFVFSVGVYTMSTGYNPMMYPMQEMMRGRAPWMMKDRYMHMPGEIQKQNIPMRSNAPYKSNDSMMQH